MEAPAAHSITFALPASFVTAIPAIAKNVNRHTYVPILANILVESDGTTLVARSTDLEVSVSYACPAPTLDPFSFTVDAMRFRDALKGAMFAQVTVDDLGIIVQANGARTELRTLPPTDFPASVRANSPGARVTGTFVHLLDALAVTAVCASKEEARGAVLMGISFEPNAKSVLGEKTGLLLTATDGYRLTSATVETTSSESTLKQFIVPGCTVPILRALPIVKKNLPNVDLIADARLVTFAVAGFEVTARLVDGTYPNYAQVLPAKPLSLPGFSIGASDFVAVLKAASKTASAGTKNGACMVTFNPAGTGAIRVAAKSDEAGSFEQIVSVNGALETATAFNGNYLAGILTPFGKARVRIVQPGPLSPTVIYDDVARTVVSVLMPLRNDKK